MKSDDNSNINSIPRIILINKDGKNIAIENEDIVGREAIGQGVLQSFDGISRRHAQFYYSEAGWSVVDLGSTNGTFINDKRILPRELISIKAGDNIRLSKSYKAEIIFERRVREELDEDAHATHPNRTNKTVMFVDLKGSTDFFQEKGTILGSNWINNFYRILKTAISDHEGIHIKNIGDAIMASFENPIKAARAALQMHSETQRFNESAHSSEHYQIKIGINYGTVLFEEGDLFGNAVNITARIQGLAPPGHTYISQDMYDRIKSINEFNIDFLGLVELRGVKTKVGIYELIDKKAPITQKTKSSPL